MNDSQGETMNLINASKILRDFFGCGDREISKLSHVEQIQLAIMIRDGVNEYPDVVPPETHRKCCGK